MDDHMPMDISRFPLAPARDTEMSNLTGGLGESIAGSTSTGLTAAGNGSRPGVRARENITPSNTDSDERPSKRARPLNSAPSSKSPFEGPSLTDTQQRQCPILLNALCKMPAAQPFLEPVNPIDAKAPDYFQVITQPMDLGTIGKKLKLRESQHAKSGLTAYSTLQEFVDDVELVFSNCFKYNTPNHAVSQLAKQVKEEFEKGMAKISGGEGLIFRPVPVMPEGPPKDAVVSPGGASEGSQLKRRPTYPPRKFSPAVYARTNRRDPLRIAQEKFCKSVLDHLYRKEYETWAFPFLQPVDLDTYPDYLSRIAKPMDLRTVHDKLSHGAYATPEEFRSDVKVMFSNCYDYNPSWAPVWQSGKELEKVFDEKWKELPLTAPAATPPKKQRSSGGSVTSQRRPKKNTKKSGSHSRLDPLDEEQKVALCEVLVALPDARMAQVIELIRDRLPKYQDNDETLTLEFENLPAEVQSEIFELLKLPRPASNHRSILSSDSSDLSSDDSD